MKKHDVLVKQTSANGLLILYLLALVAALIVGAADVAVAATGGTVPDVFKRSWPYRRLLLFGLCAAAAILLGFVLMTRFGLEAAADRAAEEEVPAVAATDGTKQTQQRDLRRDLAVAAFGLDRRTWLGLAVVAHLVALFAAGLTLWLDRHPGRAEPRLELYC